MATLALSTNSTTVMSRVVQSPATPTASKVTLATVIDAGTGTEPPWKWFHSTTSVPVVGVVMLTAVIASKGKSPPCTAEPVTPTVTTAES